MSNEIKKEYVKRSVIERKLPLKIETRGIKLANALFEFRRTLPASTRSGDLLALDKARSILSWMTDKEFETISERATKAWLQ